MLPIPSPITKPTILIVEGREDKEFFSEFLKNIKIDGVEIRAADSKDKTPQLLKSLVATPGFDDVTSIGLVRDADSDPDAAFKSVCSALRNAGLKPPKRRLQTTETTPKITIMILSPDKLPGMLENLCLDALSQIPATLCVDAYFECLSQQNISLPDIMLPKSKLQVLLASKIGRKDKTGLWLGIAVKRSWWPWEHPAFNQVKAFLRQIASFSND